MTIADATGGGRMQVAFVDLQRLLFSTEGRIGRGTWWMSVIGIAIVGSVLSLVLWRLAGPNRLTPFLVMAALLYPAYCVTAKRFQDRNRPGTLALVGIGAVVLKAILDMLQVTGDPRDRNVVDYLFAIAQIGIGVWYLVALGCLRGTIGYNAYGADPITASISRDRRWALRWSYFFLVLFAIFFLTPPVYMFITSLKTSAEISAATNPWWVFKPTLENYIELLTQNQYLTFFRNSAIVSVCVVALTMLISVPAAFALARMKFWGSATLATGVFLTYLIPETLLFIPLFKTFAFIRDTLGIELMNHWWTLIILYPTLTVPFCTWIMIGYFASIPKELDEAALIDGASWTQTLTKIFIPVALPGIIAATIFAFTVSWAQFLYPLAFTTSTDQLVLPVGIITSLIKGDVFNWGQIMTGALLGAAPPLIIYAFLMDYYIAGLTAGATKG